MAGKWRIISHEHREWIIVSGDARCAVRPDLGRALLPLTGSRPGHLEIICQLERARWTEDRSSLIQVARGLARILGESPVPSKPGQEKRYSRPGITLGGRAIWLRLVLVPTAVTQWLASRLVCLAGWPQLAAMATGGMVWYWFGLQGQGPSIVGGLPRLMVSGTDLVLALGLFLLTGLWHELGHATALRREGYAPGPIGMGVLFVIPVLYADVTPVVVLPRSGRLRVGVAGVCFQLLMGGALLAVGPEKPAAQMAGWLALAAVLWSLLPFIRADGYWLLADALKLSDLEAPAPVDRRARLRVFLVCHRLLNALFLVLVGTVFPMRINGLLAPIAGRWGIPLWIPGGVVLVLAGAAWWGMIRRLVLLMQSSREDLRRLRQL